MTHAVQNPFKARRHYLGMTQDQAAEKAGVTRQTVCDVEVGLYRKPPPSLLGALSSSETDRERLTVDYATWVTLKRRENNLLFFEYEVDSFSEYAEKIGGSLRGFCRALVVQRSLVQEYVKHGSNWNYIESCLWQAGLSGDYTRHLGELPR